MQDTPHIAEVLHIKRLIEAKLGHHLVAHGLGDGHVIAIKGPAGNGVHHEKDDERDDDEGDCDRDEAAEDVG